MPRWAWHIITVSMVRWVGIERRAVIVEVEEIRMQMERVDRIELGHVDRDRCAPGRAFSMRIGLLK